MEPTTMYLAASFGVKVLGGLLGRSAEKKRNAELRRQQAKANKEARRAAAFQKMQNQRRKSEFQSQKASQENQVQENTLRDIAKNNLSMSMTGLSGGIFEQQKKQILAAEGKVMHNIRTNADIERRNLADVDAQIEAQLRSRIDNRKIQDPTFLEGVADIAGSALDAYGSYLSMK